MAEKEVSEYAHKDVTTNDKVYNIGLKLIREYGYLGMCTDKAVKYYCMCNNLRRKYGEFIR